MANQTYQLVMKSGPAPGKIFKLETGEISLGRDMGSTVFVNDAEVSRRHAHLTLQAGNYVLEDFGSTNGTYVNGQRLSGPRALQAGDTIQLGEKVSLVFETVPFDPNATVASMPVTSDKPEVQPQPQPSIQPQAQPEVVTPKEEIFYAPPPIQAQPEYVPPARETYVPPLPSQQAYVPPKQEAYVPASTPPPPPIYAKAEPVSEFDQYTTEEPKPRRTWLWAGCGCLLVVLCLAAVGIYVFDYLNLYCTSPFQSLTVFLGGVCP